MFDSGCEFSPVLREGTASHERGLSRREPPYGIVHPFVNISAAGVVLKRGSIGMDRYTPQAGSVPPAFNSPLRYQKVMLYPAYSAERGPPQEPFHQQITRTDLVRTWSR